MEDLELAIHPAHHLQEGRRLWRQGCRGAFELHKPWQGVLRRVRCATTPTVLSARWLTEGRGFRAWKGGRRHRGLTEWCRGVAVHGCSQPKTREFPEGNGRNMARAETEDEQQQAEAEEQQEQEQEEE